MLKLISVLIDTVESSDNLKTKNIQILKDTSSFSNLDSNVRKHLLKRLESDRSESVLRRAGQSTIKLWFIINKCIEIEDTNICNFGVMSDKPGTGKTYAILGLIYRSLSFFSFDFWSVENLTSTFLLSSWVLLFYWNSLLKIELQQVWVASPLRRKQLK